MTTDFRFQIYQLIAPDSPTTKKILRYARSKGLQLHDAEDIAQETALCSLAYAKAFPDRFNGERTVIGIAKKCIVNEYRRRRQKRCPLTSYGELGEIEQPIENHIQEPRNDLEQRLHQFKPRTREIAVRWLIDRQKHDEIAKSLGISKSAVRSHLHRVRAAFRAERRSISTCQS
jgi:RNA polymerase sigma factor (sigma-70 family)